jgi:signal peptidase I
MSQALLLGAVLGLAVAGLVLLRSLVVVRVCGHSMHPTLRDGDRFLALLHVPPWLVRRGSVVMGEQPDDLKPRDVDTVGIQTVPPPGINAAFRKPPPAMHLPYKQTGRFVKRVIGRPRDRVTLQLADLLRTPDGLQLPEDELAPFLVGQNGTATWVVPEGHFFVRADGWGGDSTVWGPIPASSIQAVAIRRFPPPPRSSPQAKASEGMG